MTIKVMFKSRGAVESFDASDWSVASEPDRLSLVDEDDDVIHMIPLASIEWFSIEPDEEVS